MGDRPQYDQYTPEQLLRIIQERADDIVKAVILSPGMQITQDGLPKTGVFPHFLMAFETVTGERLVVRDKDAEAVLNDGVLNRMKIRIEFGPSGW